MGNVQYALLGLRWTSDTCVEKLQVLTCLLGLSLDDIAARPRLLAYSVSGLLGPRVWFSGAIEAPNTVMTSGLFGYITCSKVSFSKKFSVPSAFPSLTFDSAFTDHWKQRWEFLRQHMKLSIETIAAHQDLLLTSLPHRLAPRWQLLSSEQATFKAEDHLTALATLSDQDFSRKFYAEGDLQSSALIWLLSSITSVPHKGYVCLPTSSAMWFWGRRFSSFAQTQWMHWLTCLVGCESIMRTAGQTDYICAIVTSRCLVAPAMLCICGSQQDWGVRQQ